MNKTSKKLVPKFVTVTWTVAVKMELPKNIGLRELNKIGSIEGAQAIDLAQQAIRDGNALVAITDIENVK